MRLAVLIVLLLAAATPATAAPPPPPPPIPAVMAPVEGYDLTTPWSLWNHWVESRKGPATEAVLAEPDVLPGEIAWGEPVVEFRKYNDYGHFLTAEVRVYCKPDKPYGVVAGTCHYRLRRAYVDRDVAGYGGENPVTRWTVDNFDSTRLVRHFRELGLAPDTDWWMVPDRAGLFATMSSPIPILIENATVVRLDSRDCPAFGRALEALDRKAFTVRLDMIGVGADYRPTRYLQPHALDARFTIRTLASGAGAAMTLEGSGVSAFTRLFQPMLDAADACETARAKPAGQP